MWGELSRDCFHGMRKLFPIGLTCDLALLDDCRVRLPLRIGTVKILTVGLSCSFLSYAGRSPFRRESTGTPRGYLAANVAHDSVLSPGTMLARLRVNQQILWIRICMEVLKCWYRNVPNSYMELRITYPGMVIIICDGDFCQGSN